jgi:hypothetical protein
MKFARTPTLDIFLGWRQGRHVIVPWLRGTATRFLDAATPRSRRRWGPTSSP